MCARRRKYEQTKLWIERNDRRRTGHKRPRALPDWRLYELVVKDRASCGELRDVEWTADDCPRRRGDAGPCIHVGCRYHACSYVDGHGGLWVDPRFEEDPYSVPTCALDIIEAGGWTLDQIAEIWDLTRERVRQIEDKAIRRFRRYCRLRGIDAEMLLPREGEDDWMVRHQPESEHWDRPSERALEACAPMPPGWRK